jgi:hypothetical protein
MSKASNPSRGPQIPPGTDPRLLVAIRQSPQSWFEGFGTWLEESSRKPTTGPANVLQRRVFEHYRQCQAAGKPCRMVVLKYRRAGSSTAGACLTYIHAMNYHARLGVIGTDYKASSNMLDMVKTYGENDCFPGWGGQIGVKMSQGQPVSGQQWDGQAQPWDQRAERIIATKLEFRHASSVELYTASNPESARSAGLSGYHATEVGRWQTGGQLDGAETLTAMRNALPKRGFHFALEESTANGASGVFYNTCRAARWPDALWTRQFMAQWPLSATEFGKDLQFVLIFAAWFEDSRHVPIEPLTEDQVQRIKDTLTEDERTLIQRFGQDGPKGQRLGGEVNATIWEQLAWRRGIIAAVCTKGGADEFKQEYPSTPAEAFRASGNPALDQEGLLAMELEARNAREPEHGVIDPEGHWTTTHENQAEWLMWERPIAGCRYLVTCDPMSGAEAVTGTGEKDRHGVFVLRDAYADEQGEYHRLKVVARIRPPCQWEDEVVSEALSGASKFYGGAVIVVEANMGAAILKSLHTEHNAPLFLREQTDKTTQQVTTSLGWWTSAGTRRQAISALQTAVREQTVELLCLHAIGELFGLVIDAKGKAIGGGSSHDDDALAIAIGLACMHAAGRFTPTIEKQPTKAPDEDRWKEW